MSSIEKYYNISKLGDYLLSLKNAHKLYKSLDVWFKTCKKMNVDSSLWAGSLLGCLRHKSIIPWDDDADVCIFENKKKSVLDKLFIEELNRWGFNLIYEISNNVLHIYREPNFNKLQNKPIIIDNGDYLFNNNRTLFNNSVPFIKSGLLDIFIFQKTKDFYRPIGFDKYIGKDHITEEQIYPLKEIEIGGCIQVKIFNKTFEYLCQLYGEDCIEKGKITHFHNYELNKFKHKGNNDIEKFDLNKIFLPSYIFVNYWKYIYESEQIEREQSPFANFIYDTFIKDKNVKNIIDLGCGNKRDSFFFKSKGLDVTGVDSAVVSMEKDNLNIIESDLIYFIDKKIFNFDLIYLRFVIHSITFREEILLFSKLFEYMNPNAMICLEFRTPNDELFQKGIEISNNEFIYNNHYRRFINPDSIKERLQNKGFKIIFYRCSKLFAMYDNFKPTVCRLVIKK